MENPVQLEKDSFSALLGGGGEARLGIGTRPPPLWVAGLSRLETEKHQAEWGRAEATLAFPT